MAAFWSDYIWPLVVMVAESVLLLVILLIAVAYVLLADRKIWAAVQIRRGPNVVGKKLPYDSLSQLRQALFAAYPHMQRIGQIAPGNAADLQKLAGLGGSTDKTPLRSGVDDFYFTNPIARCSAVMAECSALAHGRSTMTAAE